MRLDVSALMYRIRRRAPLHRLVPPVARRLPGTSEVFGPPRKILSNAEYARRHVAAWTVVVPAHKPHNPAPITFASQRLDYGSARVSVFPDAGVLRLKNARLIPEQGWVIGEGDCYLPDNSWSGWELTPFNQTIYRQLRLGPQTWLGGISLNLTSEFGGTNYGHFLLDAMPRLHLYLAAGNKIASVDHVIVPTRRYPTLARLLAAIGIPDSKIVTPEMGRHLKCEILWAPSFPGWRRNVPSWVVDFWRVSLGTPSPMPARRLFLSRPGQRRSLSNRDEIEPQLLRRGFELITGDAPPSYFAEASVVVGEFGAGMADLVFCQPGTKVIQLTPPGHLLPHFYSIAAAGGMQFHAILGSYADKAKWPINTQEENFRVDPAFLSAALDAFIG